MMLALFIRLRNVIGAFKKQDQKDPAGRGHDSQICFTFFMADLTGNGNAKLQKRNKVQHKQRRVRRMTACWMEIYIYICTQIYIYKCYNLKVNLFALLLVLLDLCFILFYCTQRTDCCSSFIRVLYSIGWGFLFGKVASCTSDLPLSIYSNFIQHLRFKEYINILKSIFPPVKHNCEALFTVCSAWTVVIFHLFFHLMAFEFALE